MGQKGAYVEDQRGQRSQRAWVVPYGVSIPSDRFFDTSTLWLGKAACRLRNWEWNPGDRLAQLRVVAARKSVRHIALLRSTSTTYQCFVSSSRSGIDRPARFVRLLQPQKHGPENEQRHEEKEKPAFAVKSPSQEPRVHVNAEQCQSPDSDAILDHRQRKA